MSKTQKQATAPTTAPAAPTAAPETETPAQLYKLMFESDTPEKAAAVLKANPEIAQRFVDAMQKGYGNAFTAKAIELASESDHSLSTRGRSQLTQSETSQAADASAPSPSEKLPYTPDGGWNAIEINKRLGQHDKIKGTDNDGDRCSYATALAAKIFDGPAAVAAFLETVLKRHDTEEGRAAKEPAEDVLRTLIPVIRGTSATYADLSWAQEALYEVTLTKGQTGTTGTKEKDSWGREITAYSLADDLPSEVIKETAWSPQDLMTRAKALKPGERLMCGWITPDFQHQIMITNEKGTLYLYDSEKQKDGGPHLRDLSVTTLAPYYADAASVDVFLKTKAEGAKPKT
jgi:hypothetical protein